MKNIIILVAIFGAVGARLERTKLISGNVYKLESQHDGAVSHLPNLIEMK